MYFNIEFNKVSCEDNCDKIIFEYNNTRNCFEKCP